VHARCYTTFVQHTLCWNNVAGTLSHDNPCFCSFPWAARSNQDDVGTSSRQIGSALLMTWEHKDIFLVEFSCAPATSAPSKSFFQLSWWYMIGVVAQLVECGILDSRPGCCCVKTLGKFLTPCVPRLTQPSILHGLVNWVSAFGLSNNKWRRWM